MIMWPLPEKPVIIIGVAPWSLLIMISLDETTKVVKRLDLEASAVDPEGFSTDLDSMPWAARQRAPMRKGKGLRGHCHAHMVERRGAMRETLRVERRGVEPA